MHSPSTAYNALGELQQIKAQEGVQVYLQIDQYIDDVLTGGERESAVRTAQDIQNKLNGEGIEVPSV